MTDLDVTTVVRRFGSDKTHVVTVPDRLITSDEYVSLGVAFVALSLPTVARCGTLLAPTKRFPVAVVMKAGTKVRCRQCVFHSGLAAQPEDAAVGA